jgi:hypothetical protein
VLCIRSSTLWALSLMGTLRLCKSVLWSPLCVGFEFASFKRSRAAVSLGHTLLLKGSTLSRVVRDAKLFGVCSKVQSSTSVSNVSKVATAVHWEAM